MMHHIPTLGIVRGAFEVDGVRYPSITAAAAATGIGREAIRGALRLRDRVLLPRPPGPGPDLVRARARALRALAAAEGWLDDA